MLKGEALDLFVTLAKGDASPPALPKLEKEFAAMMVPPAETLDAERANEDD